jgi:2'-5' RNA ligase
VAAPLILTLEMDGEAFARLNEVRRAHLSPGNTVPAHVSLFRQLPGDRARDLKLLLRCVVEKQKPIEATVSEVKVLEQGVAFFLRSPALHALHDFLQAEWWPWLTDEDRRGFRPHVTVVNNVPLPEAERIRRDVAAGFRPFPLTGIGVHLWRYRDGPWEDVQLFRFR